MQSSENSSKATSLGSLSRLWQAKSLFLGGSNLEASLSPVKQVIVQNLRPFLDSPEAKAMVPGLASGITTALALVSDQECLEFLFDAEKLICQTLDELQPLVESYAASEQLAATANSAE